MPGVTIAMQDGKVFFTDASGQGKVVTPKTLPEGGVELDVVPFPRTPALNPDATKRAVLKVLYRLAHKITLDDFLLVGGALGLKDLTVEEFARQMRAAQEDRDGD